MGYRNYNITVTGLLDGTTVGDLNAVPDGGGAVPDGQCFDDLRAGPALSTWALDGMPTIDLGATTVNFTGNLGILRFGRGTYNADIGFTHVWIHGVKIIYDSGVAAGRALIRYPRRASVGGFAVGDLALAPTLGASDDRPDSFQPGPVVPRGAQLYFLTDDTDNTFAGSPVAGPHKIILSVSYITSFEELCGAYKAQVCRNTAQRIYDLENPA